MNSRNDSRAILEQAERRLADAPTPEAASSATELEALQLIAAIRDGAVDPVELPDARRADLFQRLGDEQCVRLLYEPEHPTPIAEPGSEDLGPIGVIGFINRWRFPMSIAAALVLTGVTYLALSPPQPQIGVPLAQLPPSVQQMAHLDRTPVLREPPVPLPLFDASIITLGPETPDAFVDWRLKTVIVLGSGSMGSGGFVGPDLIITNYHVVEEAVQAAAPTGDVASVSIILAEVVGEGDQRRIRRRDGELRAEVIRTHPENDMALLRLRQFPPGVTAMRHFTLADTVRNGEEVFALGSAGRGLAWGIKTGVVTRHRLPDDWTDIQLATGPVAVHQLRYHGDILASECGIAGGYSGGPLLNAKGELVGINFGTAAHPQADRVALHVALEPVRAFLADPPSAPEGSPLDIWGGGTQYIAMIGPLAQDLNDDGKIDSVVCIFDDRPPTSEGERPPPAVVAMFFDLNPGGGRTTLRDANVTSLNPAGLWGRESQGAFHFDIVILNRSDGLCAIGYTNASGQVDEIRISRNVASGEDADLIWRRTPTGKWTATKPSPGTPLLALEKLGIPKALRLQALFKK